MRCWRTWSTPPWRKPPTRGGPMTKTSDPFERHGIDHLSPSSLRLWRDAPAVWIGKYMLRAPDETGPGAWRGKAIEVAVDRLLFGLGAPLQEAAMRDQWNL